MNMKSLAKRKDQAPAEKKNERTITPAVDVFETESALVILADLPGVNKKSLDVRVEEDVLTIKGGIEAETKAETIYEEYEPAAYFRQFELSEVVDQDHIKADMKHGVLAIELPKVPKAQPKRIEVKVA